MWLPVRTTTSTARMEHATWPTQTLKRRSGTPIATNTTPKTLRSCHKENSHEKELRDLLCKFSEFFFIRSHRTCDRALLRSRRTPSHSRAALPPSSISVNDHLLL